MLGAARAAFAAIAAALALTAPAQAETSRRPNIVLIVADDHGLDAIGAYGNPVIRTPSIDRLAREGVSFTHAFATVASCSPSRSVLLTGLHGHENGMYGLEHEIHNFRSFDHVVSLPVRLSDAGYRTARIGKYHLAPDSVYRFDAVLSAGAANDMASIARSPVEMAGLAARFISAGEAPFFLYFASDDPHRGFPFDTAPAPNRFGNRDQGYPGVAEIAYSPAQVLAPPFLPDLPQVRAEIAEYYQSVSRLDQGVGRLIEVIEESGKLQDTVIFYLSDNGAAFPGAKTTLYEPGIHLPLIVRDPRSRRRSARSDALVSWADITPTILEYAGVEVAPDIYRGVSFTGAIRSGEPGRREMVFGSHSFHEIHMDYPMRMVRTRDYKLIRNIRHQIAFPLASDLLLSTTWRGFRESGGEVFGQRPVDAFFFRPEYELYDLSADPAEIRNLFDDPAHAEVRGRLMTALDRFSAATHDPWASIWSAE